MSKGYLSQAGIGLAITLAVLVLQFAPFSHLNNVINRLDGILYDMRLSYLPPWPESVANIQILDIDEASLQEFGRMPWPRTQFAQLTRLLTEQGAITIAFDVLFTEPEINAATKVLAAVSDPKTVKDIQEVAPKLDGDAMFANTMRKNEVVLATLFHQEQDIQKGQLFRPSLVNQGDPSNNRLYSFKGYSANTRVLAEHAVSQGFVNVVPDSDGFIRRSPLVVQQDSTIYPSLALAAFQSYSLAEAIELIWQQQEGRAFLTAVKIGNAMIPTDNKGQLLLPYRKFAYFYPYTPAAEVLAGRIQDQRFDGAVVFVGSSATGLADLRTTPVALNFPGVEIHATVFDALMSPQTQPFRPDWWQGMVAILIMGIGLLFSLLMPKLSPRATELFALLVLLITLAANLLMWHEFYMDLPLTSTLLVIICLSTYYIGHGFLRENTRRRQVKAIFEQYVPPAHIEDILEQPDAINLEGQKKYLSVLFCDIRSFTTISESLAPEQLTRWLNQFFSPITEDIFNHKGTIDKYVGDMVIAFWGAPLDDKHHVTNALKTAFAMQATARRLEKTFLDKNWPVAKIGIGINSGEMNVGDMGSKYRLSYTVLGDAVNLGSRLEGLTKFYGVDILLGEESKHTLEAESSEFLTEVAFLLVDKVKVKGKLQPVTIFCPLNLHLQPELMESCQQFNQMMELYFSRQFNQAEALLEQLADGFFNQTIILLYRERIRQMLKTPPDENWNGAYVHQSK